MVAESQRPEFHRMLLELCGSEEAAAHAETAYWLLRKMVPDELIGFQALLVRTLIRMRCLDAFRFEGEWLVAVDGTWLRTYKERHCPHCLWQRQTDGSILYFHAVLEAKLMLRGGLCLSLASVAIQNEGEYEKQDCEMSAFPRLAAKLKELFPRLPMCILGDSLYACSPVMDVCERMRWSYMLTFKEGRTPALWQRALETAQKGRTVRNRLPDGTVQTFRWAVMLEHGAHTVHAVICREKPPDGDEALWAWLTDHRPCRSNGESVQRDIPDISLRGAYAARIQIRFVAPT